MIRKLAAVTATAVGVALPGVVPAQAAPSAVIHCTTEVRLNTLTQIARVRVLSNHAANARVHSYIAYYVDRRNTTESLTFIPFGPAVNLGGHNWTKFRSWQSGTECKPWILQGDF